MQRDFGTFRTTSSWSTISTAISSTHCSCAVGVQIGAAETPPRHEMTLKRIIDFSTDELDNPLLSAKYVWGALAISRSSLFAILGEANINFASHIREHRLAMSLAQIRDPRLAGIAIGNIARRAAGFASQESFTPAFKRRFGAPPGSYRVKVDA